MSRSQMINNAWDGVQTVINEKRDMLFIITHKLANEPYKNLQEQLVDAKKIGTLAEDLEQLIATRDIITRSRKDKPEQPTYSICLDEDTIKTGIIGRQAAIHEAYQIEKTTNPTQGENIYVNEHRYDQAEVIHVIEVDF